eukprot:1860416-Rhodomonas_salina.1
MGARPTTALVPKKSRPQLQIYTAEPSEAELKAAWVSQLIPEPPLAFQNEVASSPLACANMRCDAMQYSAMRCDAMRCDAVICNVHAPCHVRD